MQAKGRSSGKFILLGEHFIVEGGTPALAFPLFDLWCEVKVSAASHPSYKAKLPGSVNADEIAALMARAVYSAADSMRLDIKAQALQVESSTNFPVSRGFGSSAAFSVALARALNEYRKQIAPEAVMTDEVLKTTHVVEKIFHGKPSGIDAGVILAGVPIRFENGAVTKTIENRAVDFVILDSGERERSSVLIQSVQAFRSGNSKSWQEMSELVRRNVDLTEKALFGGGSDEVAASVGEVHGILSKLGLSNPTIDAIIADAKLFGALAGKVSGAGGGGAVVLVAKKGEGKKLAHGMQETGRAVIAVSEAVK